MGRRRVRVLAAVVSLLAIGTAVWAFRGYVTGVVPSALAGGAMQVDALEVPQGFRIALYAEDVTGARSITPGPDGVHFVGTRGGVVHAVVDRDGDHRAERVLRIASGLDMPNGVAYRDGALFVAEVSRITRYDDIATYLEAPPAPEVVRDDLPTEHHHGWKFIAFGPDGLLYVPVGAPCNVCERDDPRFASILRMAPDGSTLEVYAHGVRNSVGFDWNPASGALWFTDNGRDWLGDDAPPDELNRAPEAGIDFGFPSCHGRAVADPDFHEPGCASTQAPEVELQAHGAALGMRFYDGDMFPERYRGGVFVAQHGSWNRSAPVGYRVIFIPIEDGEAGDVEVFAEGWLQGSAAWGRPVDVEVLKDGSLLISDDKASALYRVSYVR